MLEISSLFSSPCTIGIGSISVVCAARSFVVVCGECSCQSCIVDAVLRIIGERYFLGCPECLWWGFVVQVQNCFCWGCLHVYLNQNVKHLLYIVKYEWRHLLKVCFIRGKSCESQGMADWSQFPRLLTLLYIWIWEFYILSAFFRPILGKEQVLWNWEWI